MVAEQFAPKDPAAWEPFNNTMAPSFSREEINYYDDDDYYGDNADEYNPDDDEEYDETEPPEGPAAFWGNPRSSGPKEQQFPGYNFTDKTPPSFSGTENFFTFEQSVRDWLDITKIPPEQQAVRLRLALKGSALTHKPLLDDTKIKQGLNDDEPPLCQGVEYFLEYFRTKYVKGADNVFLFRFFKVI